MPKIAPQPRALKPPATPEIGIPDRSVSALAQLSSTIGNAALRRLLQRQSYFDSAEDQPGTISGGADYGGMLPSDGDDGVASIPEQGDEPGSSLPPTEDSSKSAWPSMPEMPEPSDLDGIIDYFAPQTDPLYSHSGCTTDFCAPFATQREAWWFRFFAGPALEAAIAAHTFSPAVARMYYIHLKGGSSSPVTPSLLRNDFEQATATTNAVLMFAERLREKYEQTPPAFPQGASMIEVDIAQELPQEVKDLNDPASSRRMDFSHPGEAPSIVAGGIGHDQTAHMIGAQPSQFNDERIASGKATVTKNPDGTLTIRVHAHFKVVDTVDMCPGNCGGTDEQVITRPLSWLEASGISGDVPIEIEFDAPEQTATTRPKAPGGGGRNPFGG
jgi:hypothetical protein